MKSQGSCDGMGPHLPWQKKTPSYLETNEMAHKIQVSRYQIPSSDSPSSLLPRHHALTFATAAWEGCVTLIRSQNI